MPDTSTHIMRTRRWTAWRASQIPPTFTTFSRAEESLFPIIQIDPDGMSRQASDVVRRVDCRGCMKEERGLCGEPFCCPYLTWFTYDMNTHQNNAGKDPLIQAHRPPKCPGQGQWFRHNEHTNPLPLTGDSFALTLTVTFRPLNNFSNSSMANIA